MMGEFFSSEREIVVVREITKIYEEHKRGTLKEVLSYFAGKTVKGEIVVIVKQS